MNSVSQPMRALAFGLTAMLLMLVFAQPAMAQRDAEWLLLGQTRVGLGIDRDSIRLDGRPVIDGVRFRLSTRGIRVLRMVLNFTDGTQYDVPSEELAAASSVGETYDFEYRPTAQTELRLEVRKEKGDVDVLTTQIVHVTQ